MSDFVISLGGSIIIPNKINTKFLKGFRDLILKHLKKGHRFFILCGGGSIARLYQTSVNKIINLTRDDLDWLGIHCTKLNAHLIRTIFRGYAYHRIIKNPNEKVKVDEMLIIASGWKPGCSTDYDAVLMAKNHKIQTIINLSNISYVYDKDPNKFKSAKKLKNLSWPEFRKIVGNRWIPGLNSPFDPIAAKLAKKANLKVIIAKGTDLVNLDKILTSKPFKGSTIN